MEKILNDMGLNQFVHSFRQRGFNLNTFKYIMSKGNDISKKIIAEDTGLSVPQVQLICQRIEQLYGTDFVNLPPGQLTNIETQQNAGQTQNQNMFPQSKALTSSYGRSNRIKKLFQIPANKPKKELSQIQRMNLARKTSQQKNQVLENFFKKPSEQQIEVLNKGSANDNGPQKENEGAETVELKDQLHHQMDVRVDESTMNLGNKLADDLLKNQEQSQQSEQQEVLLENDNDKREEVQVEDHEHDNNEDEDLIEVDEGENVKHQLLNNKASQDYVMDKLNDLKNHPQSQHYSQTNPQMDEDSSSCMDDEKEMGQQYPIKEPAQPNYISSSQYSEQNQYAAPDQLLQQKEEANSMNKQSETLNVEADQNLQNEYYEERMKANGQQLRENFDQMDENQLMMEKANQFLQQNSQGNQEINQLNNANNQDESRSDGTSQISNQEQQEHCQANEADIAQEENSQVQDEESASSITSSQEQNVDDGQTLQQNQHLSRPTIGLKEPASNSFRQPNQNNYQQPAPHHNLNTTVENKNVNVHNQLEELQRQLEELQKQQQMTTKQPEAYKQNQQSADVGVNKGNGLAQQVLQESSNSVQDESVGYNEDDQESSDQGMEEEGVDTNNNHQQQPNSNILQFTEQEVANAQQDNEHQVECKDQESSSPEESGQSSYTNSENNQNNNEPMRQQQNEYKNQGEQNEAKLEQEDNSASYSNSNENQNEASSHSDINDESDQDLPSDSEFNNAAQKKKDCLKMQSMWGAGKQIHDSQQQQSQNLKDESDSICSSDQQSSQDEEMEDNNFHQSLQVSNQQIDESYKSIGNPSHHNDKQLEVPENNNAQMLNQEEPIALNKHNINSFTSNNINFNNNHVHPNQDSHSLNQCKSPQSFSNNVVNQDQSYLRPNRSPQELINQVQKIEELYNSHQPKITNIIDSSTDNHYAQQPNQQPNMYSIQNENQMSTNQANHKPHLQSLQNSNAKPINYHQVDQQFNQQAYAAYDESKIDQLFSKEHHSLSNENVRDKVRSQEVNDEMNRKYDQSASHQVHEDTHQQMMASMLHDTNSQNPNINQSNLGPLLNKNPPSTSPLQNRQDDGEGRKTEQVINMRTSSPFKISLNNQDGESADNLGMASKGIQTAIEYPVNDQMRYDQYVQINPRDLVMHKDSMCQSLTYQQLESEVADELKHKLQTSIEKHVRQELTQSIYEKATVDLQNRIGEQICQNERQKLTQQAKIDLKPEIESEIKQNLEQKAHFQQEQLRQQLLAEKRQEVEHARQKALMEMQQLEEKTKQGEYKSNQYIDMIKRKDRELEELKRAEQETQNLVANLNDNVHHLKQQVQHLEQANETSKQQMIQDKERLDGQTRNYQKMIENQELELKNARDKVMQKQEQLKMLEKQLDEKAEQNKAISENLSLLKQQEKDNQANHKLLAERQALESENLRKQIVQYEKIVSEYKQNEQAEQEKRLRDEKIKQDIAEKQKQLNDLKALQKSKERAQTQQQQSYHHSSKQNQQHSISDNIQQKLIQQRSPKIERLIVRDQIGLDQDKQNQDGGYKEFQDVGKKQDMLERNDESQNKRIEKQKYKEQKENYSILKQQIQQQQYQAAEMQQKLQQLEMRKRELSEKGAQSSSSKNELGTQSQDYGNTESDDRQMRTIIQKSVQAYDSLEQKKRQIERQNQNLQHMVYSSQISNHNYNQTNHNQQQKVQSNTNTEPQGKNNKIPQYTSAQLTPGISVINLDDEGDDQLSAINSQSPSKHSRNMSHVKEESSFLPDQIVPPAKVEKKKIVKRVRFHDDENNELIYPAGNGNNNEVKRQKLDEPNNNQDDNDCLNIGRQQFIEEQEDTAKGVENNRHKIEDLMVDNIKRQQKYEIANRDSIYSNGYNAQQRNFNKKIYFEDKQQRKPNQDHDWEQKQIRKKSKQKNASMKGHGSSRSQSPAPEQTTGNGTATSSWTGNVNLQSPVGAKKQIGGKFLDNKMEEYVNNLDSGTKRNSNLMNMIKKITGQK